MRISHVPDTVSVPQHFVLYSQQTSDASVDVSVSQMRILRLQAQRYTACKWESQGLPSFEVHVLRFNTPWKTLVVPGGE